MADIAAEAGVSRATAYRQIGSVENATLLLVSRELQRQLASLPARIGTARGIDAIVSLFTALIEDIRRHPVVAKVLADEPELIGSSLVRHHHDVIARIAPLVEPVVRRLAPRIDAGVTADALVRLGASLVLAPPRVELTHYLRRVLTPLFRKKETAHGRSDR